MDHKLSGGDFGGTMGFFPKDQLGEQIRLTTDSGDIFVYELRLVLKERIGIFVGMGEAPVT